MVKQRLAIIRNRASRETLIKKRHQTGPVESTINFKNLGCMMSSEQKVGLRIAMVSLSTGSEIKKIPGSRMQQKDGRFNMSKAYVGS